MVLFLAGISLLWLLFCGAAFGFGGVVFGVAVMCIIGGIVGACRK